MWYLSRQLKKLESFSLDGDRPVNEICLKTYWYPEYNEARGTLLESAGTIR